ncbi:hypothetical protein BY996DRAFT_4580488, partial [Phakopsora pachyrhizi]
LDYGHRAIVRLVSLPRVYGLWAIWQIHKANIAAGAEYNESIEARTHRAIAEGRAPPEKLDKPASYYLKNDTSSSSSFQ